MEDNKILYFCFVFMSCISAFAKMHLALTNFFFLVDSIPTPFSPAASQASPSLCGSLEEESPFPSFAQVRDKSKSCQNYLYLSG